MPNCTPGAAAPMGVVAMVPPSPPRIASRSAKTLLGGEGRGEGSKNASAGCPSSAYRASATTMQMKIPTVFDGPGG